MGHLPLQSEGLINWFRSLFKYTPPAAHDEVTAEIVQLTLLRHCDASIMRAPGFYWSLCAVVCLSRLDPTRVCSASHRPFACPLLARNASSPRCSDFDFCHADEGAGCGAEVAAGAQVSSWHSADDLADAAKLVWNRRVSCRAGKATGIRSRRAALDPLLASQAPPFRACEATIASVLLSLQPFSQRR